MNAGSSIRSRFNKAVNHPVGLVVANTIMATAVGVGTGLVSPKVALLTGMGIIAGSIATHAIHRFDR